MAPPFEQTLITHTQGLCVQYLVIVLSSFGEEDDFQRFAVNLLHAQIVLEYYFTYNVGGATILNKL